MKLSNEPRAAVAETGTEAEEDGEPSGPPTTPAVFAFSNRILFGEGALRSLPEELARLGERLAPRRLEQALEDRHAEDLHVHRVERVAG